MHQFDILTIRMTLRAVQNGLNVPDALQLCEWCLDGAEDIEEALHQLLRLALEAGDTHGPVVICAPKNYKSQAGKESVNA